MKGDTITLVATRKADQPLLQRAYFYDNIDVPCGACGEIVSHRPIPMGFKVVAVECLQCSAARGLPDRIIATPLAFQEMRAYLEFERKRQ